MTRSSSGLPRWRGRRWRRHDGFSVAGARSVATAAGGECWASDRALGYTFGFLAVIPRRQLLPRTRTAVLPFADQAGLANFALLLRLWSVCWWAFAGVSLFDSACCICSSSCADPTRVCRYWPGVDGEHAVRDVQGILAGWIIAMMVDAGRQRASRLAIIVICTYLIAIAGFTPSSGRPRRCTRVCRRDLADAVLHRLAALAGNVVGGSLIFG